MSLKAKLLLDSSDYNKKMDQAKAKASATGQDIKDKMSRAGEGFEAINKLGGATGGVMKNVQQAIAGMMSPIGLVMAGIAALGALAVKVFDKMTESAEQYTKKITIEAQRSKKAYQDSLKQTSGDEQYFNRLQEIADAENVSNEMKLQAIRIIDILSKKYGDLGININMATGEIEGLTEAQQKFFKMAQKLGISKSATALKDQNNVTSDAANSALGYQKNWIQSLFGYSPERNFTPLDFGGGSHGTTMATYWNHNALANGQRGLKDKKDSWLSNADQKKYAGLILDSRKTISELQKKLKENPKSDTAEADRRKLEQLKLEESHYVNMLKLTQKLKVSRAMIRNSKNNDDIDKWKKVEVEILKTIDLQNQYYMQAKAGVQSQKAFAMKGRKQSQSKNSKETLKYLQDQKKYMEEANTIFQRRNKQGVKDAYIRLDSQEKIKYNQAEIKEFEEKIKFSKEEVAKLNDQLKNTRKLQKQLAVKIKNKTATPEQQTKYTELGKQQAEMRAGIAKNLKFQQQCLSGIYAAELQIYDLKKQQQKYYNDQKTSLDQQIQLTRLQLKGKTEEIEKQKLINDIKAKGLKVDQQQINNILKKKRQLGRLNMIASVRADGKESLYKIQQYFDPQQAEINKRLEQKREIKGSALTKRQRNAITKQVQLEFKADNAMKIKPDLSGFQTFTNQLASRGGFSSAVVSGSKNDVNQRIFKTQKQAESTLRTILAEMKKLGVIS